jgi:hypothetical protein
MSDTDTQFATSAPTFASPVGAPPAPMPTSSPAPSGVGGFVHPVAVASLSAEQASAELARLQRPDSAYWTGDKLAVQRALALRQHVAAVEAEASPLAAPGTHEPLSESEVGAKVNNHLSFPSIADPSEAQEVRAGLTSAVVTLGMSAAEAGMLILEMNTKMRSPETLTTGQLETRLRREWGANFDRFMRGARGALDHAEKARPGLRQFLETSGMGNNYTVACMLARSGQRMGW